jgi:hypothetical protein
MHKHLKTCFVEAVLYGREQAAIDELVGAVKFTPALTAQLDMAVIAPGAASDTRQLLGATTLSLPGISSQRCKAAIEGIVTAIADVGAVDVLTTTGRTGSLDPCSDRPGVDDRERAPRLATAGSRLAPEEHDALQAALGFLDGNGI